MSTEHIGGPISLYYADIAAARFKTDPDLKHGIDTVVEVFNADAGVRLTSVQKGRNSAVHFMRFPALAQDIPPDERRLLGHEDYRTSPESDLIIATQASDNPSHFLIVTNEAIATNGYTVNFGRQGNASWPRVYSDPTLPGIYRGSGEKIDDLLPATTEACLSVARFVLGIS